MYSIVILLSVASWAYCLDPEVQKKHETLPREEFIEYFNKADFSWKIKSNDFVGDDMIRSLHIPEITIPTKQKDTTGMLSFHTYPFIVFDARMIWPNCFTIGSIFIPDNNCTSHWASTAAAVATDRMCISNPIHRTYILSPYDLTCCKNCFKESYCNGGSAEQGLMFWLSDGIVTLSCKPNINVNETCDKDCTTDVASYLADKHFASQVYRMPEDDLQIRSELFVSGPLLATFAVYEDFKDYSEGIYEHKYGKLVGYHSVKVIGFGADRKGVPYWLAVNSWGQKWGEEGTFKIKRWQPDLGFEKRMIGANPRIIH